MSVQTPRAPGVAHIALLIANLGGGGAQRRMVALANAFAARGHRVDLLTAEAGGVLAPRIAPDVERVCFESFRTRLPGVRGTKRRRMLAALPGVARYLHQSAPDVLMASSDSVNVLAVLAHRLARCPTRLVLRIDNPVSRPAAAGRRTSQRRRLQRARRLFARADRLVAISHGVAQDLLAHGVGRPEQIEVIHNPVVDDGLLAAAREPAGHAWLDEPGPPVVLGVGRLVAQKDFETLLGAFARVCEHAEARLIVLGEGPERASLEARAAALGIEGRFHLPGAHANPSAAMARAGVFALSSRWEGFGSVVVEALAAGCPVVATDCPSGPREILEGGRFGALVPVADEAALADALLAALRDPGDPGARIARAWDFAVDAVADRYLAVLLG